jgi:hypothetical protein
MVSNLGFMNLEVERFQDLLKVASDRWGGGREISGQAADLWLDYAADGSSKDNCIPLTSSSSKSKKNDGSIIGFMSSSESSGNKKRENEM